MKHNLLIFLAILLSIPVGAVSYRKTTDGVVVTLSSKSDTTARMVRLQVVDSKIIRVTAVPGRKFPKEKSLVVLPEAYKKTPFTVEESDGRLRLETDAVRAMVDLETGEVAFADTCGTMRLQERRGGGKKFKPITVDGVSAYSYWQQFESPDNEAFYGLGQHQSDEFNYKGKNESLFQYNTKVAVPFIISNKNYGLLFDTYPCVSGETVAITCSYAMRSIYTMPMGNPEH